MFIVAFLLRLAISPNFGFHGDLRLFQKWAMELRAVGMYYFYAADPNVDYPPGYLYVLWAIGKVSASPGYQLLKLPSNIADLALAWIVGTFGARLAPVSLTQRIPLRGVLAAAVLFNPAVFGLSAGWGQVDAIPVCFILGSFLLLLTGEQTFRREMAAALLFGFAFSIKPQTTLAFPVIAYALYRQYFHRTARAQVLNAAMKVAALGAVSLGVWMLLGLPFGLGPAGLLKLYQHASSLYPVTTANAFNFWGIIAFWRPDSYVKVAGIPASQFGLLVYVVGTAYMLWQLHRAIERGADARLAMFVAAGVLSLVGYTFLTRMHERYLFVPLMYFAPVLFSRPFRLSYAGLSVLFLLSLWVPYVEFNSQWRVPALLYQPWFDWLEGGWDPNSWQKKGWSLAVTVIAVVAALRSLRWVENATQSVSAAPKVPRAVQPAPILRSSAEPAPTEDAGEATSSRGLARWIPLSLVGLSSLFGLVILRGETRYAENLNDSALHLLMVKWASGQLHEGRLPLDGWFPYFSLGSSFFHHYQTASHTFTALLANVSGLSDQTLYLWLQYLLLALWPIAVYTSARLLDWNKWTAACAAAVSPLLVSAPGYGYEHGSYTWQGYGVYSQLWGMWLLPLAWGLTWRAVTRGKHYAAAAVALALTIACHFTTGYLALLTLGVWVIVVGKTPFTQKVYRAAIVAGGSLLIAAWVVVPLLTDMKYSAQSEYYKGTFFNDSYGASRVLGWLFSGELFDLNRRPVITLMVAVGSIVCFARARHEMRARALLGAFVLSLLLFFGRPTLGPVLDLLPGFGDIQIHRFMMGVDLAAILLAGVGLAWLVRAAYSLGLRISGSTRGVAAGAALLLGVVLLAPALIERTRYARRGEAFIRSQRASDRTDGRDLNSLMEIVRNRNDGRVYAGLRANWGKSYRVRSVPVHVWLANRELDAVGFTFRTVTSLSTDIEAAFDETNAAQYQMLNVRYVIVPSSRRPAVPAQAIARKGRHRLFQVSTSGYFQVVDRAAAVSADRANIELATKEFRSSDLALRGIYPGVAFAGAPSLPPTFAGTSPPPGQPGDVIAQTHTLQDGVFDAAVELKRPAVVLLKATYDPRWTATVDGQPVKPMMMAPSLVGVEVPSGTHAVGFRYKPYGGYPLLLAIGALTLLALVLVPRRAAIRRDEAVAPQPAQPQEVKSQPSAPVVEEKAEAVSPQPSLLPPTRPSARILAAAGVASIVLILGAYSNSLHNGFHFDDYNTILDNVFIRDLKNVPHFFTDARTYSSNPSNAAYRPLVTLTFAIDYWLQSGLDPLQFHITELALLILTGFMLYAFYVKLFSSTGVKSSSSYWAALFAATLFCVHTANTQTGNHMNSRSELLSGLGVLGAFLMYCYGSRLRRYYIYLLPVILGVFAKTPVVMFAPLLLLYKLFIEEQLSLREVFSRGAWPGVRRALVTSAPAFVLAVLLFVFVEKMNAPTLSWGGTTRGRYLLTETWVWVRYARLFFLPTGLTADTDLSPFTSWLNWRVAAGIVLVVLSIVAIWRASRDRENRPVAFGIVWFWIALIPTSTVIPLAEVTNDYRVFFPFMGLAAAVVWWVALQIGGAKLRGVAGHRLPQLVTVVAVLVLAVHAVGTFHRNRVWLNDETLWGDVVKKSPRNGRGLMNYGLTQMSQGRLAVAKDLFTRSYAINPDYVYVHINLAVVSNALGDTAAAQQWFERALRTAPENASARQFFGAWLARHGRVPEAIPQLQKAIELSPAAFEARHQLLDLYAAQRDTANLRKLAQETLDLAGSDSVALSYLSTSRK